MDRQLGKLFDHIRNDPELADNTMILICSDNGPDPGAGSAEPLRGYKTHLYEGEYARPCRLGHQFNECEDRRNSKQNFCFRPLI